MKNLTVRTLMLEISEIDETRNPFVIAKKLVDALLNLDITPKQYELLIGDLQIECKRNNINMISKTCSII